MHNFSMRRARRVAREALASKGAIAAAAAAAASTASVDYTAEAAAAYIRDVRCAIDDIF